MWFEILLVFILFKFKTCPNISGIQVVVMVIQFGVYNLEWPSWDDLLVNILPIIIHK